jgi:hypothetical protein
MPWRTSQGTPVERRPPWWFPGRRVAESIVALSLIVSWNPVTTSCKGLAPLTPVDHYDLIIFEARIIGSMNGAPIYTKSFSHSTTATSLDIDPKVGEVVGWAGMWDASYTLQNPPVVAVSLAGNRSDAPCP